MRDSGDESYVTNGIGVESTRADDQHMPEIKSPSALYDYYKGLYDEDVEDKIKKDL